MPTRVVYAVCIYSLGFGLFVLFGVALPAARDGGTVLGTLAVICAIIGTLLGAAGIVALVRQSRRRP